MHGAGNDFVVLDNRNGKLNEILLTQPAALCRLANRHMGVGADQILVVEEAQNPINDFKYRIFNADGAEVQQCGNGARCFAQYVHEKGFTNKKTLRVETQAGVIEPQLLGPNRVRVNMGPVHFGVPHVPFLDGNLPSYTQCGLVHYPAVD